MPVLSRLSPRDPSEGHRAATPLELFFDLTFVVAVAQAASGLEHGLVDGHLRAVLIGYPMVFFAIWWAWMNFTWFASAYDNDDVAYRLGVLVQMTGVLILAAGVPRALESGDFAVILVGYLVMRLAMVTLWLRAAVSDRPGRRCALRYAVGITVVQAGWVVWWVVLPRSARLWLFLVLAAAELAVPLWAEAAGRTSWHPGHIAERYGLFTIIVLGESLLAPTVGVGGRSERPHHLRPSGHPWSSAGSSSSSRCGGSTSTCRQARSSSRSARPSPSGSAGHSSGATGIMSCSPVPPPPGPACSSPWTRPAIRPDSPSSRPAGPSPCPSPPIWWWSGLCTFPYKRRGILRSVVVPVSAALILASSASPVPVLATGILLVAVVAVSVAANRPRSSPPAGTEAPAAEANEANPITALSGRQPDPR